MPSTMIKVASERATQLKTLASERGISITELLGILVNNEIKAGRLPDATPGFEIRKLAGGKTFSLGITPDCTIPRLSAERLHQLADVISAAATSKGFGGKSIEVGSINLTIARAGVGVVILATAKATGVSARRSLPPDLALDLARQLRNAT